MPTGILDTNVLAHVVRRIGRLQTAARNNVDDCWLIVVVDVYWRLEPQGLFETPAA